MVKIKSIELQGLYSYDSSSEINFDDTNLIVGTNNSGKSSLFKAIDFFLTSLTDYGCGGLMPWKSQLDHDMKINFSLSGLEARYLLQILSVIPNDNNNRTFHLTSHDMTSHYEKLVDEISLEITWKNTPFQDRILDLEYLLIIPKLNLKITSHGFNQETWVSSLDEESTKGFSNRGTFGEIVEKARPFSLERFDNEILQLNDTDGLRVFPYPDPNKFAKNSIHVREIDSTTHMRIDMVYDMAGIIPTNGSDHSFFFMLGSMLRTKIALLSDSRNFQETNDLVRHNFYNDGSNLQNFLFYLRNGDNQEDKKRFDLIKNEFEKVFSSQNLTFDLEIISKGLPSNDKLVSNTGKTIPDKVTTTFSDTMYGTDSLKFLAVGSGIRETLFILSKCIGHNDGIVLMDEPALNLHPLQIQTLMRRIIAIQNEDSSDNQIMIITHSPTLASIEMLSTVNEIIRVERIGDSSIVYQPIQGDRKWIQKNIATFHLMKPDILFAKCVILVEGQSDRIFLQTLLNESERLGLEDNDIFILDVGGKKSFTKFETFLDIFKIPYLILADRDAEDIFKDRELSILDKKFDTNQTSQEHQNIYILEEDLESYLGKINPELFHEVVAKYSKRKPEIAYHVIQGLLKNKISPELKPIIFIFKHALALIRLDYE
jgi:predicted ATP-dependent endonuclease of OLD family